MIAGVAADASRTVFPVVTWDVTAEDPEPTSFNARGPVFALAFSGDGTRLALGNWDSTIELVNPRTGQALAPPIVGHAGPVFGLGFFPDGETLIAGAEDQTLRLWDGNKGVQLAKLPPLDAPRLLRLVLEPQGHWMASKQQGQTIRLWRFDAEPDPRRAEMLWQEEGVPAGRRGEFTQTWDIAQRAVQGNAPDQAGGEPWFALAALAPRSWTGCSREPASVPAHGDGSSGCLTKPCWPKPRR